MIKIKIFLVVAILLMGEGVLYAQNTTIGNQKLMIIQFVGADLQSAINSAPPFSTIICNKNQQLVISETVLIKKPITLKNLNALLPDSLGKTSILEVHSEGVTISNFYLRGNANTVDQIDRAPLIRIYKSNFRLERGFFENSSKDGVEISPLANSGDIDGGVVRDIVGLGCVRDVISINGSHEKESACIRNILVENIRAYDSSLRGPVEVSDGSENITVRKIYAENCVYAVDWQDHSRRLEINRNVLIDDVYALNCRYAIRNAVKDFGHTNLTITNIIAEKCQEPLKIANTSNIIIQNVRIIDHVGNKNPMVARNCNGLTIRNISISNSTSNKEGILIENCNEVLVDGVSLLKNTESLSSGVTYSISQDRIFENFRITNVSAKNVQNAGIVLEKKNEATLKDYIISGNIAKIKDSIEGENSNQFQNIQ